MIKTAVSDTSLWTPRQVLLAPLWGVATTTRLQGKAGLPSQWQLYQRRATLGSKHLCQTFKGEQAGSKQLLLTDAGLCASPPSLNQTVASSDISERMNSPWQVSLPYLWPRRSASGFSIARSTNSISIPPPDREDLGQAGQARKIGQLCLRRVLD